MKLPRKVVLILVAVSIGIALILINFSLDKVEKGSVDPKEKVVEKAFHTEDLSTFVTALKTANLEEELNNSKSLTIFAPSDSAFSMLPEGKYAEIMKAENKEELKKILSIHIVDGAISTYDFKNGQALKTIQGDTIYISLNEDEDKTEVNGTTLVKTDIQASNGIIHVIDKVMTPAENSAKKQATLQK